MFTQPSNPSIEVCVESFRNRLPQQKVTAVPSHLKGDAFDVALVAFAVRPNEIRWQTRLLAHCLEAGQKVVCLARRNSLQWYKAEESGFLEYGQSGYGQQCLLDPMEWFQQDNVSIAKQAGADWSMFERLLNPVGLGLSDECLSQFTNVALMNALWPPLLERLRPRWLVIRNNHSPENTTAALATRGLGTRCMSFQHSVLTSMPSLVPTLADVFVCAGETSRRLLEQAAAPFAGFDPVFQPAGCWAGTHELIGADAGRKRVLWIDQECGWAQRYFGTGSAFEHAYQLADKVLASQSELRWRVRLHPDSEDVSGWRRLQQVHGRRLEISDGSDTLEQDFEHASIVCGQFSTALYEAANSGLSVMRVHENGWFDSPDLADLAAVTVEAHLAVEKLALLHADAESFNTWRYASRAAAEQYYKADRGGLQSLSKLFQREDQTAPVISRRIS